MKEITIKLFDLDNDAFIGCQEAEIADILNALAKNITLGYRPEKLKDINGNTVGIVEYQEG